MKQTRRRVPDRDQVQEAVNHYMQDLADLTVNSKPQINALTMLAEDYLDYAEPLVKAIDDHLQKVSSNVKLPTLYLIDSIIKNVGKDYINLFTRSIVQSFCTVFEQVDEKTRQQMYKLRQTWNEIIPQECLYTLDVNIKALDPKWPITAAPTLTPVPHKIHINPKFLHTSSGQPAAIASAKSIPQSSVAVTVKSTAVPESATADAEAALREQILQRKRLLLKLEQEKVDLELSQTKAKLDKKHKVVNKLNEKTTLENTPPSSLMKESSLLSLDSVFINTGTSNKVQQEQKKIPKLEPTSDSAHLLFSNAPKIAPVSSGLVNLVASQRAQRDPRLSKQSKEILPSEDRSKEKSRDPRLANKQSRSSDKESEKLIRSSGKVSDKRAKSSDKDSEKRSRSSEKDSEKRSRSAEKDSEKRSRSSEKDSDKRARSSEKESDKQSRSSEKESPSKSSRNRSRDSSQERSSSRHSTRRDDRDKRVNEARKSSRKSDDQSISRSKKTSSHSSSNSSKSSSKGDSNRSQRKSTRSVHRPVSDVADSSESDSSDSKVATGTSLNMCGTSGPGSSDWAVNYTKGSHKGRNYMRRNRSEDSSEVTSTATSDVDLRVGGPPEKQIRLSSPSETSPSRSSSALSSLLPEQILPSLASQDVDLRRFAPSPNKKRQSAEPEDEPPPSKKNKTAYLEMLFGNQDVDLRLMDMKNGLSSDAPSPPPPPVISSPGGQSAYSDNCLGWSKFKQALTPSPTTLSSPVFPRSSRHDRLGSNVENEVGYKEDTDMRISINGQETSPKQNIQVILATAAEQVKNGTMSPADFKQVQKQVFRMHESEKIREAQLNDYSRNEAWERRPQVEKDYRHGASPAESERFGDIDERFPPPRPVKKTLLPLPSIPPMQPHSIRHMGPRMSGQGPMQGYMRPIRPVMGGPRGHMRGSWRHPRMGPNPIVIPPADTFLLARIAQDSMKAITIDGFPREIRFYGDAAVAFLGSDNPCQICFEPGDASIIINDVVVRSSFNQPDQEVNIGGKIYRVRLGAPTRELYVNDEGFECQFNSPAREICLDTGDILQVELQSKTDPIVHVGVQRKDLVAGRVTMIIDAESAIPIFLDAKPQRFDIDGVPHIIRFADKLETVLINKHPFDIQFGGPAVPFAVENRRHYIRLTELPPDVIPGQVEIVSMSHFRTKPKVPRSVSGSGPATWGTAGPSNSSGLGPQPSQPARAPAPEEDHEPALPVRGGLGALNRGLPKKIMKPKRPPRDSSEATKSGRTEDRQMPADLLQALQPGIPALRGLLDNSNNSGYNSTIPTYGMRQGVGTGAASTGQISTNIPAASAPAAAPSAATSNTTPKSSAGSNGIPFLAPELDVHKLFQSLYESGVISSITLSNDPKKGKAEEEDRKKIHEVDFKETSTFKVKQPALISILYSGMQCASCGTRFPPEQTEKYSSHLDWHFRQNRRDKDSARKPQSRKWYYDVTDWIQFEEIDDTVEKTQNWFDTQQTETAKFEEPEEEEIQSVPSKDFPEGTICDLCHDRFDQFYNEEKEEWHLKDCLVADGLPYHPFCYKDYRVSVESNEEVSSEDKKQPEDDQQIDNNPTESGEIMVDEIKKEPEETIDEGIVVKEENEGFLGEGGKVDLKEESKSEPSTDEGGLASVECEQEVPENFADSDIKKELEEREMETETKAELETEPEPESEAGGAPLKAEEVEDSAETEKSVDEKEEPTKCDTPEEAPVLADTTSAVVQCSIDGNMELSQAPTAMLPIPNRIKINISKPIVKPVEDTEDESDRASESGDAVITAGLSEPAPPTKEQLILKPKLVGRKLSVLPPKLKGNETSGLCSVM